MSLNDDLQKRIKKLTEDISKVLSTGKVANKEIQRLIHEFQKESDKRNRQAKPETALVVYNKHKYTGEVKLFLTTTDLAFLKSQGIDTSDLC